MEACSIDRAAVARANKTSMGSMTDRKLRRSNIRPVNGFITTQAILAKAIADEITPRPKWRSCANGLMNMPFPNTMMDAWPKIRARADAKTTHHLFLNIHFPFSVPVIVGLGFISCQPYSLRRNDGHLRESLRLLVLGQGQTVVRSASDSPYSWARGIVIV